jgi:hypothetical protein
MTVVWNYTCSEWKMNHQYLGSKPYAVYQKTFHFDIAPYVSYITIGFVPSKQLWKITIPLVFLDRFTMICGDQLYKSSSDAKSEVEYFLSKLEKLKVLI